MNFIRLGSDHVNIGLTGGIATGKSTVSAMLVQRGAVLIDADQIARDVVLPGSPVLDKVVSKFGQAVLLEDGSLHRKKLGQIIFGNPKARKELEAILHPPIRAMIKSQMEALEKEDPHRLVVVDIPLLFESKLQEPYSEIMLVYVPTAIQKQRLMQRDHLNEIEAEARLNSQMPIEEKKKLADIVIDNSGTIEETDKQIDFFWQRKRL
jgi:dephospho-CoA kinase